MQQKDNSVAKLLSQINFKMGKKLGEGRFSIVKLGTHSLTGQPVAIKILDKTKIAKLEDKERINKEIQIMKKINHFNITKLYTIIDTKYIIYLIQEYVQGKELNDYLYAKGKLTEPEACKIFHQIISGLSYLHYIGIAHRDFKPENILLTNDNKILKIIDFGLGNMYKKGQLLKTGCGSPCYIPPEMIKEEGYDGAKSDIWSAGIILYLMLCGHLPFYEEDNQLMYNKIIEGQYTIPQYLSEEAKDIIKKILEIDPKKRLNFEEIKEHPWFNIINKKYMMYKGIDIEENIIPIDEDIVEQMEKYGINKIETRYHILKNYHNKITTIYDLLLKKKIDSGKNSIADLQSDIYNEYMKDPNNKISHYGNIDSMLKHRIGNDKKVLNILPKWDENVYENNNESIIIGDSGSVMERLIKAGKFTYDEENMCLNKVNNYTNKIVKKKEKKENEDDSKFKTISSIKTVSDRKYKKIGSQEINEENNLKTKSNKKTHYDENEKNKEINNDSWNYKKVKTEIKKGKMEEEDWYKEMEKLIDEENLVNKNNKKLLNSKNNINKNNNNKQIKGIKSTKIHNNTNKNNHNKNYKNYNNKKEVSSFLLDKENKDIKKNQVLSALNKKISNVQLKKPITYNNSNIITNRFRSSTTKVPSNYNKNNKIFKKEVPITKENKGKINKKKQKSLDKNKNINLNNREKMRDYDENFEIKERRRNQSFQKRNKKIKI